MDSSHKLFLLLALSGLFFSSFFATSFASTNDTDSSTSNFSNHTLNNGSTGQASTQGNSQGGASQGSSQSNSQGSNAQISLKGSFSKVYAFGDSNTDKGNAVFLAGSGFAGFSSAIRSSLAPLGNQNFVCPFRLMIDFLCEELGLPPLPSYKNSSVTNFSHGVNFAISGSTFMSSDYFNQLAKVATAFLTGSPVNFQTQIDWFHDFQNQVGCKGKDGCKAEMENTLFWVGGLGIDDHARAITSPNSLLWLRDKSILSISSFIQKLLDSGAKYIVVQGLPPLGCLTLEVATCPVENLLSKLGCTAAANAAAAIHNQLLQQKLASFRAQYPNTSIIYADIYAAFLRILQNPAKFMFQETFKACCGTGGNLNFNMHSLCGAPGTSKCSDPSKYIFWDGIHLTEAMNRYLIDLLLNQGFCQPSFAEMVHNKTGH